MSKNIKKYKKMIFDRVAHQMKKIKVRRDEKVNQDRHPNFRDKKGKLYLVRCFACGGKLGTENYTMAVASGQCAWCGWKEK